MDMRAIIKLAEAAAPSFSFVFYGYQDEVEKRGQFPAEASAVSEFCQEMASFIDWNDHCRVVLVLPNGKQVEYGRHDLEQEYDASSLASNTTKDLMRMLGTE